MHRIREASPDDVPALAKMRYELRSAISPPIEKEQDFVARCAAWMRERLSPSSTWRCWVAEAEDRLDGQVWLALIEKMPNPVDEPEWHAYISNAYVRPESRGGGIGSQLLAAALDWCRARSVDSVILWPTERSRALYARHGFRETNDVMVARVRSTSSQAPSESRPSQPPGPPQRQPSRSRRS